MANNYDKILELANANNMGLSNTIKRDFGIPLDFTSVQADYEAALNYAASSTLAYVGQPISVGDKLYIVTAESQGKYPAEVAEGESQVDVYLAEVGSATEGDGKTISLVDGVLSLYGIDGKDSGTYVPSLVNGVLTWNKPDTTTVDGLTATVEGLEDRAEALELTINGREASEGVEAVEGLTSKVAANAQAIADAEESLSNAISGEANARAEAIKTVTDSIGEVTEGKTVVEMIADAENAAKAAIPTAVSAFTNDANYQNADQVSSAISTAIAGKANSTDVYTKGEVNSKIERLENTIAGITHFTTKIVLSTTDVTEAGVLYLIKDDTATGTDIYREYLFIEGAGAVLIGDTTTDLSDYITNSALASALAPYAKSTDVVSNTTFATFQETNAAAINKARTDAVNDVEAKGYAVASVVNASLAGKVDTATLTSYYTKDATDAKFAVAETVSAELSNKADKETTYTKVEVNEIQASLNTSIELKADKATTYTKEEINELLADIEGGSTESAASVSRALEAYKTSNDAAVASLEARVGIAKAGEVAATGLFAKVDTAQATADSVATAVLTLENGQVKTNKENIASAVIRIQNVEAQAATNKTDIATLTGTVNGLSAVVEGHTTKLADVEGQIVALSNKDSELDTAIKANSSEIAKKANASDVYTKGEVDATLVVINANIDKKANAAEVYTKAEVDNLLTNLDQTELENNISANATDIAVLIGSDKDENGKANKSIRAIAADEINTLIKAADPENGKTIEHISDLVKYVDENAGDIAELITSTNLSSAKLDGIETTVVAAIQAAKEEAIAAIPALEVATTENLGGIKSATGDNKVTVAENGVASVESVNVNTLTQTAGEILVLNGGSAAN